MCRKRIKIEVFVDLDPVPGAFHTEESAVAIVEALLNHTIPRYNPTVSNPSTLSARLEAARMGRT